MQMTTELFNAASRSFIACNLKPKNVSDILSKLEAQGVTASVAGNMLELKQGDTIFSLGVALSAYAEKNPRDFYGAAGSVNFKSDLKGDVAGKIAFIKQNGLSAWEELPYDEKSITAKHVVRSVLPHAGMTKSEYAQLSIAEKIKLCSEIGAAGVSAIMARVR